MSDPTPNGTADTIQSIERAVAAFVVLVEQPEGMSSSALAAATGISRPAMRRILLTLEGTGFVSHARGVWRPSLRVVTLARKVVSRIPLASIARPIVRELAIELHATVGVAQREGGEAVLIVESRSPTFVSVALETGDRLPLHATASGQVLLAWDDAPDEESASIALTAMTPNTPVDRDELEAILATAREQGHVIADQQLEIGLIAAAVPLLSRTGVFVGALYCAMSAAYASIEDVENTMVPRLKTAAATIGSRL